MDERVKEDEEIIDLEAKVKNLKTDKEFLKKEKGELEEKLKALEPSWIYKVCDKIGLVKVKNMAVNALVIVGFIGVIYVISLILRYLVKPTFGNFTELFGFFKSKKPKRIVEAEAEEDEEEETIFEVEPEAKKLSTRKPRKKKAIS